MSNIETYNCSFRDLQIDSKIDLLYLDPPYNLKDKNYDKENDSYYNFLKDIFNKFNNFSTMWLFNEWQNSEIVTKICREFNYHIIMPIIWFRSSPGKAGQRYKMNYEIIYWIVKDKNDFTFNRQYNRMEGNQVLPYYDKNKNPRGWSYNDKGERLRDAEIGSVWIYPEEKMPMALECDGKRKRIEEVTNVWCDTRPFWSMPEKTSHTCQKPQSLIERIIKTSTNENELIVDLFAGTFSCGRAASILNRSYIGCEINKNFYNEGIKFISDGLGQKSIRN